MAVRNPLVAPVLGRPLTTTAEAAERILGHRFARPALLHEALTHRSAARKLPGGRRGSGSNERLEFIGDRVLGLAIAEWLIERFPNEQEGELGRRLAHLVSGPVIASIAEHIQLSALLDLAPGEDRAGVRTSATVAADATEAAIGALYLDGGLIAATTFIRQAWATTLDAQSEPPKDPKTRLQEWAQARGHDLPAYEISSREGPPHAPVFVVAVRITGKLGQIGAAAGEARSKRDAEQMAATALLHHLHTAP